LPKGRFTEVASHLTSLDIEEYKTKYETRLERLARGKQSGLFSLESMAKKV
jgi:hypothetical protein